MRAQNNQSSGGGESTIKKFPGSGKEIPAGSKVTQTTSTNDKGQKVTTTTATRSGNKIPLDVRNKVRQRRGLPPIESGNTSTSSSKTIGVDTSPGKSDTKSLVNNNKKKNIKDAQKAVQQQNQKNKEVADMTGEPAGKVTTGKINFGGF